MHQVAGSISQQPWHTPLKEDYLTAHTKNILHRVLQISFYLNESRDNLWEHLMQTFLGQSLDYFCEHLNGSQIDRIICRLNDGTQHLNALLWADGTCQHGCCFFCCPDHLHTQTHRQTHTVYIQFKK